MADKSYTNNLYYFSLNTYLKYEFLDKNILLNIIAGVSNANGVRNQILPKGDETKKYGRLTIPFYLKFVAWNASTKRIVSEVQKGKDFKRISSFVKLVVSILENFLLSSLARRSAIKEEINLSSESVTLISFTV